MNTPGNPYPFVRVSPIAKEYLMKIVAACKARGLRITASSFLTNLILSQPMPCENGNGHQPNLMTSLEEEGKKGDSNVGLY